MTNYSKAYLTNAFREETGLPAFDLSGPTREFTEWLKELNVSVEIYNTRPLAPNVKYMASWGLKRATLSSRTKVN